MGSTTSYVVSAQEHAATMTVEQDTITGAGESVEDDASGVKVVADQHIVGDDSSLANADVVQPGSAASVKDVEEIPKDDGEESTDTKPDRPAVWGSASNGVGTAESEASTAAFAGKRKPAAAGDKPLVPEDQDAEISGRTTDSSSADIKNHQQVKEQHPSTGTVFGAVKHDGSNVQTSEKAHAAFVKSGDAAKKDSVSPPLAGSSDSIAAAAMRKKAAAAAAAAASPIPKVNTTGGENAQSIEPPEGYYLAAHVVTDPRDGLSYFATAESWSVNENESHHDSHLEIPYQDCGYSGSTTQAIPLKSGHFRHLPPGVHPQTWTTATSTRSPGAALISNLISGSDSSDGSSGAGTGHRKDPQLLVVLKPLELTVSGNGGESRRFRAGDCVLLEDTVGKGHKLSPIGGEELSVLMLALPRHHHAHHHHYHHQQKEELHIPLMDSENGEKGQTDTHPGIFRPTNSVASANSKAGRHLSVLGLRRRGINKGRLPRPCRVPHSSSLSGDASVLVTDGESTATFLSDGDSVAAAILGADGFLGRRRAFIGTVGFGLSAFTAYFLGQVAPWVLGLMGLLTAFVGGTIVFDGLIGAVWSEVSDLVQKIKDGSLLIDGEEEQDEAIDDSISNQ